MAHRWLVGMALTFATYSFSTESIDCRKAAEALGYSVKVEMGTNSYEVTDLEHPDFHVIGSLRSDGTLTISMLRANDKKGEMKAKLGQVLGRILEHFPNRRAIEIKLSQKDQLGSYEYSREPVLEAFNQAWKKNQGESEEVRRTRAVQAVPELKQISDALGDTVKIEFSSYTQPIASRGPGKTTDSGYLKLGLRLEAQPASEKQKP
jgi:hypothetical protein